MILAKRDHDLTKQLLKLRDAICVDFKDCRLTNFQCLKKYSAGGIPASYITNCQRISCKNFNCLTNPCDSDEYCHPQGEHDHYCLRQKPNQAPADPCKVKLKTLLTIIRPLRDFLRMRRKFKLMSQVSRSDFVNSSINCQ